ncbi:hypothetical protein D1BOALGB6SA_9893 [Olavius sp. associated proteobacterium Delta 1]|nr:hypothetical protein D1BOALGB6SA_9893 [Olavius sp. associated proteobacterium Delta 1]
MNSSIFSKSFPKNQTELDSTQIQEIENLYANINVLISLLRTKIKKKWNRYLPINEMFSDRLEKSKFMGFGPDTSIYDSSLVFGDVTIGEHTWVGPFTILDGSGGLSIGDNCSISSGVQIYTHDSVAWAISGGETKIDIAPTQIGSRCYIGPNSIISKGVTIGDGSIIGAMSLVTENIPPNSKAHGIPAKVIGIAD